jgi:hypothetical protein
MGKAQPTQAENAKPDTATSPWTEPFQSAQTDADGAARPEQRDNTSAAAPAQREADSARATQDALSVIFNQT